MFNSLIWIQSVDVDTHVSNSDELCVLFLHEHYTSTNKTGIAIKKTLEAELSKTGSQKQIIPVYVTFYRIHLEVESLSTGKLPSFHDFK